MFSIRLSSERTGVKAIGIEPLPSFSNRHPISHLLGIVEEARFDMLSNVKCKFVQQESLNLDGRLPAFIDSAFMHRSFTS